MILDYLNGPCYIYLFTDDHDPARVAHEIMSHCSPEDCNRITLQWRTEENREDAHVIEDFFDMMRFEYLIRARSNFSLYVERLGNSKIAIVPADARSGNPWGIVTAIAVTIYRNLISRTQCVTKKIIPFTDIFQKQECQQIFGTP
jgi:hypothetical protein